MRSARINFGLPESEYIVEVDNTGAAVSCKNQDTNTEYVGGGGDFSTAEVTINNELSFNFSLPYLSEYEGNEFILCSGSTSGTFNVVLYKGNAVLVFVEEISAVYTGNVTELEAGFAYLITGDATITVTSI